MKMNKGIVFFLYLGIFIFYSCQNKQTLQKSVEPSDMAFPVVDDNSFMMRMQERALQEPFVGIVTSAGKMDSLFTIRSTGVTTKPIVEAGIKFVEALTPDQKKKTLHNVQDQEWQKWSNVDHGIFRRAGISLKEMNSEQKALAFALMEKSLSAKGLTLSRNIMKTDQTLNELNKGNIIYDEELYFFTVMGQPSYTEPWGWQIDGHHLVINYFIIGDQVVMTPTFMGAEPTVTTTGKYKGNTLFQDEQNLGLKLIQGLPTAQRNKAIISTVKKDVHNQTEAFKDNESIDYSGINAAELNAKNRKALINLIEQYVSNMSAGHAQIKMKEVLGHIDETYFTWIGKTSDDAVFYYRIQSPVILIEFDHQGIIAGPGHDREPTRNHIHTVVRTPNGNDYGKDLLRQHLEAHH